MLARMVAHRFTQVDVFSAVPLLGNALAVIHDADDLSDEQLAAVARWTNLSETTFLCRPTTPEADYRVRIFTTGGELPFAGHPTLGSAHAWLVGGGTPDIPEVVVQECAAGLVPVSRRERLAFAAPPLRRSGPVSDEVRRHVIAINALDPAEVLDVEWIDNGPGWVGVELRSAAAVLAARPDPTAYAGAKVALLGRYAAGEAEHLGKDVEVRAFYADGRDFGEDPVTGSANAGLAQWLIGAGRLPDTYVAGQGGCVQRDGRIHIERRLADIWVGGDVSTVVTGTIDL
jgi:PhzF family phenazine biosynthesis protein